MMTSLPSQARSRPRSPGIITGKPARAKPRAESAIQADIVGYLRAVLLPGDALVYANANAARRTACGFAANGVPGLCPGIPDLTVIKRDGRAFYLEVKNEVGRLSPVQEAMLDRLRVMRVPCAVVRGIDDVRAALAAWNIGTREATSC